MKKYIIKLLSLIDYLLVPFVYLSGLLLKNVRRAGIHRLPKSKITLLKIGVFPICDHYYEPQFNFIDSKQSYSHNRKLNGINWNVREQIDLLQNFTYAKELFEVPTEISIFNEYYFGNKAFESGDAEYWYSLIRYFKPKRIYEVGSGNSTLMAIKAIRKNILEDPDFSCKHVCIEPYEMPWLEETGVMVKRNKIEDMGVTFFSELQKNDVLFIDSSHIIRPQGDVLFLFLELLPMLNSGVIVHVHDIFSPKNYPKSWLEDKVKCWNEQ